MSLTKASRRRWFEFVSVVAIGALAFSSLAPATHAAEPGMGSLTVTTELIIDHGGSWVASDFTVMVHDEDGALVDSFAGSESGVLLDNLEPGVYTVTQTGPTEFNTFWDECGGGSVTVEADEAATCTIVNNDKMVRVTLDAVVVNDNGGTATADEFDLYLGDTLAEQGDQFDAYIGTYLVSAVGPDGYEASFSGDCTAAGSLTLTGITYDYSAEFSCTITLDDIPGELTVIKEVVNDDGGTGVAADASISVTGTNVSDAEFAGDSEGVVVTLDAGAYTVVEAEMEDYAASYSDECEGEIAIGETRTCTITNNDIPKSPTLGTITVTKIVVNDDAGVGAVEDFPLFVGAVEVTSGESMEFAAGTYAITETDADGYEATFSGDCDEEGMITLADGEDLTCTIVNNDIGEVEEETGTLVIVKNVINDDGGMDEANAFDLDISGVNPSVTSVIGSETGIAVTLEPGDYAVTEAAYAGYTASFSEDCSGTIADGETKTCVVTNDDVDSEGTITIIKEVINDDGGTGVIADFPLFVDGDAVVSGQAMEFAAGTYAVTEANAEGYSASFSGDCDEDGMITLEAGEDLTCTMTNDDIAEDAEEGTITVVKQVVNDDGGDGEVSDFPLSVGSTQVASGEITTFPVGTYTVSESNASGYSVSFSGDCDANGVVTLDADEDLVCIMINNDIADEDDDEDEEEEEEDDDIDVDEDDDIDVNVDVNVTTGDTNVDTGDVNVTTGDVNVTTGDNDNDVVVTTGGTPPPLVLGETDEDDDDDDDTTPPPVGGVLGEDDVLPRTGGLPAAPLMSAAALMGAYLITRRRA